MAKFISELDNYKLIYFTCGIRGKNANKKQTRVE